jgi:hypothetical protein
VDDPLLQKSYGYLDYDSLLEMMKQHRFQTSIAFIPHNFRKTSQRIANEFHESQGRLSLCFHGNDHTGAEFAAGDPAALHAMIQNAEERIATHTRRTGLRCERVMVFPQGKFSVAAMNALKLENFDAAVNTTPHPLGQNLKLTLAERIQPAVLRYAGFPLFLRKSSKLTTQPEIAFNLFWGKPVIIVEHHQIFQNPQPLLDAVADINAIAPHIRWADIGTVVRNSVLRRRSEGVCQVRAYARTVQIVSTSGAATGQVSVEWCNSGQDLAISGTLLNGQPHAFRTTSSGVQVDAELQASGEGLMSVIAQPTVLRLQKFGMRYRLHAFARRRLSEIRDNYLCKRPSMLNAAKNLQRALTARSV